MAATLDIDKKTLVGSVMSAFLGINVRHESDSAARGGPIGSFARTTTFKAFEDAGVVANNDAFAFEKHLIYVGDPDIVGHYFQGALFVRTFVSAFLHRYQREEISYQQYLKGQKIPPSLKAESPAMDIAHLHEDISRKVIVDIDSGDPIFEVSATGIVDVAFGDAFTFETRSLHTKRVLKFKWDRSQGGPNLIKLPLKGVVDGSQFRFFSFNITQIYFEDDKSGPDVALEVSLVSDNNGSPAFSTLNVKDFAGLLRYPPSEILFDGPDPDHPENDVTMNAMRAVNLPLIDFVAASISFKIKKLIAVQFTFSGNPVGKDQNAVFMINEIKLLH